MSETIVNGKPYLRKNNGTLSSSNPKTRTMYKKLKATELEKYNNEKKVLHHKHDNESVIAYYCTLC